MNEQRDTPDGGNSNPQPDEMDACASPDAPSVEMDTCDTAMPSVDSVEDSQDIQELPAGFEPDAKAAEDIAVEKPDEEDAGTPDHGLDLEELTLPSSITSLDPLPEGAVVDPSGSTTIRQLLQKRGQINRYVAMQRDAAGQERVVDLHEGPADHAGLLRAAEVLGQVQYAMLPRLYGTWEQEGRRYLALESFDTPTLAEVLSSGMRTDEVVSTVLQLVQATRRLQRDGWVLVGLSPDGVRMGDPIRITALSTAIRIGEVPSMALHVPGYSAPELAQHTAVTGKEDVFTLATILYQGLSGELTPEDSPELVDLAATVRTPGAPQIIASGLAPVDRRVDLDTFYRDLLGLKRRLARAPIALQVASGTSIGLNESRKVNEDACGYLTWSVAHEGRMALNALLCVIDGMGGMEAGEVAATAALRSVLRDAATYAAEQIASSAGADLTGETPRIAAVLNPRNLVRAAAERTHAAAGGRNVGATITCLVVEDGKVKLGHVGDTRAYLLRDGALRQLTRDHSLVAAMVASGTLTKEEARNHPEANKVLRSLGGMKTLPDEYVDSLAVVCGEEELLLRDGDQLLLCSDGVWGELDDAALLSILTEAPDSESAVRVAIQRVLEEGASDNAAIVVARCVSMPAT